MKITIENRDTGKIYEVTKLYILGTNWSAEHTGMKNEWDKAYGKEERDYHNCSYDENNSLWELTIDVRGA